jgi:hypothetical protein
LGEGIGDRDIGENEPERRPPSGGGERVLTVSGDWSWYGAKSMLS